MSVFNTAVYGCCTGLLIDNIALYVARNAGRHKVKIVDYGFGIRYSYAVLSIDGVEYVGATHTLINNMVGKKPYSGPVRIDELLSYVSSINPYLKQIGHSIINAYNQYLLENGLTVKPVGEGEVLNLLDLENKLTVIIGDLRPIVDYLRSRNYEFYVFESAPCRRDIAYPEFYYYRALPRADNLIITGSTLTNDSIDEILRYKKPSAVTVLMGPSASVPAESLIGKGIDMIASTHIPSEKTWRTVKTIIRGGGTKQIKELGMKYIQIINP